MIEKIIKKNKVFQAQLFYIFLSIVIGSTVSNFFLRFPIGQESTSVHFWIR